MAAIEFLGRICLDQSPKCLDSRQTVFQHPCPALGCSLGSDVGSTTSSRRAIIAKWRKGAWESEIFEVRRSFFQRWVAKGNIDLSSALHGSG